MKTLFSTFIGLVLLLSMITAHSATYYFHNDHLGTPQVVTDESQAVVWQGDYDPFGKATETVATIEQNLRFPGQYLDRESGLHYNYFRTYDPQIGRYSQSDPIGLIGGISTYAYTEQNPISKIDIFGLNPHDPITRHITANAAKGNWDEVAEMLRTISHYSDKDFKKLVELCISKRKKNLLDEFKQSGVGAGARSGQHGTPFKQAGAQLVREAKIMSNSVVKDALKKAGERLIAKGKGINH